MEANNITEYTNPFKDIVPTHALVTNVQMQDGTQRAITTLFSCSEFDLEYINRGVRIALFNQDWLPIEKSQSTLYHLGKGQPEASLCFPVEYHQNKQYESK